MLTRAIPSADCFSPHPVQCDATNEWIDANCYMDVWISLVHLLGLNPYPLLAVTLSINFDGDQWTFFKPDPEEIRLFYGIGVQEMSVFRPLPDHITTQLQRPAVPILEVDAFYLADVGQTYLQRHEKTTIAALGLDSSRRTIEYLHNHGAFVATDADYEGLLTTRTNQWLPGYVEIASLDGLRQLPNEVLAELAHARAVEHVARRTARRQCPAGTFGTYIEAVMCDGRFPGGFDGFAFATFRQLGAASAFAAQFLGWLATETNADDQAGIDAFNAISVCAKRMLLKLARAQRRATVVDFRRDIADLDDAGHRADTALAAQFGSSR